MDHRMDVINGEGDCFVPRNDSAVLLTAEEAAEVLKVAASTVYRLMRSGEMRVVRFGRSVRIKAEDLQSFIDEHVN